MRFRQFYIFLAHFSAAMLLTHAGHPEAIRPAVKFLEYTETSGLGFEGLTFGAASGDFDKDGLPDILVSHSCERVSLYRNRGDGRFINDTKGYCLSATGDVHGVGWVDLDNDAWLDIFLCYGAARGTGGKNNVLYRNLEGRSFSPVELAPALADFYASGRSICPANLNNDPYVDLVLVNHIRQDRSLNRVLLNRLIETDTIHGRVAIFDAEAIDQPEFAAQEAQNVYCIRYPEMASPLFVTGRGRIYRMDEGHVLRDATTELGIALNGFEKAVTPIDFDSDGDLDLYYLRGYTGPLAIERRGNSLHFAFDQDGGGNISFDFEADGTIQFEGRPGIHLGSDTETIRHGVITISDGYPGLEADLKPEDVAEGAHLCRFAPGKYRYICAPGAGALFGPSGKITSVTGKIEVIATQGSHPASMQEISTHLGNTMYEWNGTGFVPVLGQEDTLGQRVSCIDAVAADFDNNGSMDLYVLSGYTHGNLPNTMLLNDGSGHFVKVSDEALERASEGVSDTALLLDANADGRMDILELNGLYGPWEGTSGKSRFFLNQTEAGRWIQIQPVGRESNYWGIGASVTVATAAGSVNQQFTGMSNARSASALPLHFGLGGQKECSVRIVWPGGAAQSLTLEAGRLHRIEEP